MSRVLLQVTVVVQLLIAITSASSNTRDSLYRRNEQGNQRRLKGSASTVKGGVKLLTVFEEAWQSAASVKKTKVEVSCVKRVAEADAAKSKTKKSKSGVGDAAASVTAGGGKGKGSSSSKAYTSTSGTGYDGSSQNGILESENTSADLIPGIVMGDTATAGGDGRRYKKRRVRRHLQTGIIPDGGVVEPVSVVDLDSSEATVEEEEELPTSSAQEPVLISEPVGISDNVAAEQEGEVLAVEESEGALILGNGDGILGRGIISGMVDSVIGRFGGIIERIDCVRERLQQFILTIIPDFESPLQGVFAELEEANSTASSVEETGNSTASSVEETGNSTANQLGDGDGLASGPLRDIIDSIVERAFGEMEPIIGACRPETTEGGGTSPKSNKSTKASKASKSSKASSDQLPFCDEASVVGDSSSKKTKSKSGSSSDDANARDEEDSSDGDTNVSDGGGGGNGINNPDGTGVIQSTPSPTPATVNDQGFDPPGGAQASVCEDFFAGEAPTDGPFQTYAMNLSILTARDADMTTVVRQLYEGLNRQIAPALLGCTGIDRRTRQLVASTRSFARRRLQVTELVNLVFEEPEVDITDGNCARTDQVDCIALIIKSTLYYNGDAPRGFAEQMRRALLFWDWESITGWRGFGAVTVTNTGGSSGDNRPTDVPGDNNGNGDDRGGVAAASGGDESVDDDRVNAGAFVAAGMAFLVLMLLAAFVIKRRHEDIDEMSDLKHHQLTDDEEEDFITEEANTTMPLERSLQSDTSPNRNSQLRPSPPRKSYIVSDEDSRAPWQNEYEEGQEVLHRSINTEEPSPIRQPRFVSTSDSYEGPYVRPSLSYDSSYEDARNMSGASRRYVADDTVDL